MSLTKYVKLIESQERALHEGAKFGAKEFAVTLRDSDNFQMGIEYECHLIKDGEIPDYSERFPYANEFIEKYNIPHIKDIEHEHDSMVEFITDIMPIRDGLKHIQLFFKSAKDFGIEFPEGAGLHLSISHKGTNQKINFAKFLVLMSGDYLNSIFPERDHTANIAPMITKAIWGKNIKTVSQAEEAINDQVDNEDDIDVDDEIGLFAKHISIKLADYHTQNGRVELRFPGGKNHNEMYKEIEWQLMRAVFLLGVAYDEKMYRKEYITTLYKVLMDAKEQHKETNEGRLTALLSAYNGNPDDAEKIIETANALITELEEDDKLNDEHGVAYITGFDSEGRFLVDIAGFINSDMSEHLEHLTGGEQLEFSLGEPDYNYMYGLLDREVQDALDEWIYDNHLSEVADALGYETEEVEMDDIRNLFDTYVEEVDEIKYIFSDVYYGLENQAVEQEMLRNIKSYLDDIVHDLHLELAGDFLRSASAFIMNNDIFKFIEEVNDFEVEDEFEGYISDWREVSDYREQLNQFIGDSISY